MTRSEFSCWISVAGRAKEVSLKESSLCVRKGAPLEMPHAKETLERAVCSQGLERAKQLSSCRTLQKILHLPTWPGSHSPGSPLVHGMFQSSSRHSDIMLSLDILTLGRFDRIILILHGLCKHLMPIEQPWDDSRTFTCAGAERAAEVQLCGHFLLLLTPHGKHHQAPQLHTLDARLGTQL